MGASGKARFFPPPGLVVEAARALLWRMSSSPRRWWRRSWVYRRILKGPLADRIVFHPYDALPRRLDDADALLRARFRFNGETLEVKEGSVFDKTPPSQEWAEALHGFAWLPPLSAAGGEAARVLATNLIGQWIKRNARYSEPAWLPHIIARRLLNMFAHGRIALSNSDILWRSKVFVSLREQSRMLARVAGEAPDGLPRFETAAALVLSGVCLDDSERRLQIGLAHLEAEIARQILPDGGHVSRSPEQLVHAYRLVLMVMDALTATNRSVPQGLRSAHDRMAPMIRFFRHGDGALALFNGGGESDARMIAGLLARDEVRGQPFGYAPHSGYHRLGTAQTLVVLDCGAPPPGAFSVHAHAGCLAFELSSAGQRIIVNCGSATSRHPQWESVLRATAAHSTLTLADTSTAAVLPQGWLRGLLGPRLRRGPLEIATSRTETTQGWSVEASHDGYVPAFGIRHERKLTLSPQGTKLSGTDRLVPGARLGEGIPYSLRFHVHPDVRVSASQGGDILLKLPHGEGWRFRASAPAFVEESVYLGSDIVRRTDQLVLAGTVKDAVVEIDWVLEQIGH